jgi:DNA polymerase-3 subunit delta'
MRALQRHIDRRVRTLAAAGTAPARLVGFARSWDDIRDLARETEVFNFDKKALALAIFDRLAGAERATR